MKTLASQLQTAVEGWESSREPRRKNTFWASETETDAFELYHKWIGTKPTNPPDAKSLLRMDCGKRIEESIVRYLEMCKILQRPTKLEEIFGFGKAKLCNLKWERHGKQFRMDLEIPVPVSGKLDGVGFGTDYYPIEVKSFYGYFQQKEVTSGKPKLSYLKQLALYMHAMQKNVGLLLYFDRSEIEMYEFILRNEEGIYRAYWYKPEKTAGYDTLKITPCGIEFKVHDILKRWQEIYSKHIVPGIEPIPEFRYKYDLDEVEHLAQKGELYKSTMQKGISGEAVIGDWQPKYSPFKDLYIAKEGDCLGYTSEEKAKLREIFAKYF